MRMDGQANLPAPRETVWAALNDPDILRQAMPGCETMAKLSETEFAATVVAKIGPVKASFNGAVTLTDVTPPYSLRLNGEGKGGAAGFAKGGADVRLEEAADGGTTLFYTVDVQIGGKLAQVGARLIDSAAKSMATEFFQRFAALLTPPADAAPATTEAELIAAGALPPPPPELLAPAEADEAEAMDDAQQQAKSLPPWIWVGGLLILVALLLAGALAR